VFKQLQFNFWSLIIGIVILIVALTPVIAQNQTQTLSFDEMVLGEINLSHIQSTYTFNGRAGETVYLRAQSLTPDFVINYTLLNADGQVIAQGTNESGQPGSLSIVELTATEQLTVQINSANNAGGQFSVSLDSALMQNSAMLPMGEIVYADAESTNPQDYLISTSDNATNFVMFETLAEANGLTITLEDAETDEIVAMFQSTVSGICMRLASHNKDYRLRVTPDNTVTTSQVYMMMFWQNDISDLSCPSNIYAPDADDDMINADQLISIDANVTVAPAGTQGVNMRTAPTTNSPIVSVLNPNEDAPVLGTTENEDWLMVNLDGTVVFVNSSVVETVLGDLEELPLVDASGLTREFNLVDVDANYGDTDTSIDIGDTVNDNGLIDGQANLDETTADAQVGDTSPISINGGDASLVNMPVVESAVDNASNVVESVSDGDAVNDVVDTVDNTVDETEDVVEDVTGTVDNVVGGLLGGD